MTRNTVAVAGGVVALAAVLAVGAIVGPRLAGAPMVTPTAVPIAISPPPMSRTLISANPGALCLLTRRDAVVQEAAASLSLAKPGTKYITAEPQRLVDWTFRGLLAISRLPGGSEIASLHDPQSGASTRLPFVPGANAVSGITVNAPWLAAPRLAGSAQPAFADVTLRSAARPGASMVAAYSSYRIALLDGAGGPGCDLGINRASGEGADLPVIAAEWSSDGRYLAVLLLADAARLGPTVLRIIDMSDNTWRQFDPGPRAISGATWRPGSHTMLLTSALIGEERDTLNMLSVLADGAIALAPLGDGLTFFAPSYWGVRFSPDGERLAIACVQPEADGVVRRGALCVWEVQP
jgi:hypothetical protein